MTDAAESYADDAREDEPQFPRDAAPWLALLRDAETADQVWHDRCDNIDKLYANLREMADEAQADREFRMFWANLEVLRPIVYSRPPVPVVSPRFRDRRPLPRACAEVLERALSADVESDHVHAHLRHIRDDLVRHGRGVAWVRYVEDRRGERATLEHLNRRDFRHGPARKWQEVPWVARRAFLTRGEMEARFGDLPDRIEYQERRLGRDDKGGESREEKKAEVWEIWHRAKRKVVWVAMGAREILDARDPWHDLDDFWPCPAPAVATLQPETLTPVPDVLYYRDQLEEINELTARIAGLAESLRMKGFYAAGSSDVGQAVEIVMSDLGNRSVLIPVSNFAALGGASLKDSIVWLPVAEVVAVLQACVQLRRQIIEDVYELTGLSDIMRGSSEASETLGAQQLKAQFGNVRVRERQGEMERIARDVIRIKAEIMAEAFAPETLFAMSQVDDIPDAAAVARMAAQAQMAGQPFEPPPVTVEAVMALLREQRLRPFALDVETDSTIQPDEDAEKQRRTEFLAAIGGLLSQALPALQAAPQIGPFMAEALRFAAGGFRAGRTMDMALDRLADEMEARAQAPEGDPAQVDAQMRRQEAEMRAQEAQAKLALDQRRAALDVETARMDAQAKQAETAAKIRLIDAQITKIQAEIGRIGAQAQAAASQPMERMDG